MKTITEKLNEKMVGAQLLTVTDEGISIKKDGKEFFLSLDDIDGDCCGYNEIESKLFYEPNSKRNSIITKVSVAVDGNYDDNNDDGQECVLTFFGEDKKLAEVNAISTSGSGWPYGACVILKCKALDIDEILSEW